MTPQLTAATAAPAAQAAGGGHYGAIYLVDELNQRFPDGGVTYPDQHLVGGQPL